MLRHLLAAALGAALLLPGQPGAALAEPPTDGASDDCGPALLDLPTETLELPDGLAWEQLADPWAGTVRTVTGDRVYIWLACSSLADHRFAREREIRDALGLVDELSTIAIGDESVATRSTDPDWPTIDVAWRHGPFTGSVSTTFDAASGTQVPMTVLEDLAVTIDVLFTRSIEQGSVVDHD